MQFKSKTSLYGRWGIEAERSEYDALPSSSTLFFDAEPASLNPDVEAIALTLLFGRYSGGEMRFTRKVSPATAVAIQRYLQPVRVFPEPIEYAPRGLPTHLGNIEVWEHTEVAPAENQFISMRSDAANGALNLHSVLAISNNSFLFKQNVSDHLPALASALLFADDLAAGTFSVPSNTISDFDDVRGLLAAVRIELTERGIR